MNWYQVMNKISASSLSVSSARKSLQPEPLNRLFHALISVGENR